MAYIVQFQLRDTMREFDTKAARDAAYDTVLQQMLDWGIPQENIILSKINSEVCSEGYTHKVIVEQTGE